MANPEEGALHYLFGDALPDVGTTMEVAPGVRWLRMPLPFALDHINLWLLRDQLDGIDGWTIVDCGITSEATRTAWDRLFSDELLGLPVLRVIVTHMHPDHIGLAHWLCERWSTAESECRLWISATDWNAARMASRSTTGFGGDAAAAFFARHGLTDLESLAKVRDRSNYYASMVPKVPDRFRRLMDGMKIEIGGRNWRCIVGHGHAPEHISLYADQLGVMISGDMVLPRISTNVSVIDIEPEANSLDLYLSSIARLLELPASTRVLPSHGKPFTGLHERIGQLQRHHDDRLAEVMKACAESACSASDLLPTMFKRKLDLHQTTFAMGEAVAHIHLLLEAGRLQRAPSSDGVWRYRAVEH